MVGGEWCEGRWSVRQRENGREGEISSCSEGGGLNECRDGGKAGVVDGGKHRAQLAVRGR